MSMPNGKRRGWKTYIRDQYLEDLAAFFQDHKTRVILAGFSDDPRQPLRYKDILKLGREEVSGRDQSPETPVKKYKDWNYNCCSAFIQNLLGWRVLRFEGEGKKKQYFLEEPWWDEAKRAKSILTLEKNSRATIVTEIERKIGGAKVLEDEEASIEKFNKLDSQLLNKFDAAFSASYIPGESGHSTDTLTIFGMNIDKLKEKGTIEEALTIMSKLHQDMSELWFRYVGDVYLEEYLESIKKLLKDWKKHAIASEWVFLAADQRHFLHSWHSAKIVQYIHVQIFGVESHLYPPIKMPPEVEEKGPGKIGFPEEYLKYILQPETPDLRKVIERGYWVSRTLAIRWIPEYYQLTNDAPIIASLKEFEDVESTGWTGSPSQQGTQKRTKAEGQFLRGVRALVYDEYMFQSVLEDTIEKIRATVPPITTVLTSRLPPASRPTPTPPSKPAGGREEPSRSPRGA